MHFDPSVNLGTMIACATFVGLFIRFHISNVERLTKIETKIDVLWAVLDMSQKRDARHERGED
jgi:hypothetical protein